jgi:transposase
MPFKSDAQRKLMYAVANNPAVAKKTGISKAVADKFIQHKAEGGMMATKMPKEGSPAYKAQERRHVSAMQKAGVPADIIAEEKREAGLKKGGCVKKYARGGRVDGCATKGKTRGRMV